MRLLDEHQLQAERSGARLSYLDVGSWYGVMVMSSPMLMTPFARRHYSRQP